MAYTDTYSVANSKSFNDGADFGDMSNPYSLGSDQIEMAPTGRSLSDLLKGFDDPGPPPVQPGSFVRQIEAEANDWGRSFGETVQQAQQAAASYWSVPVAAAPARSPTSALDSLGGIADGLANTLTGSIPQQGVETAALDSSQRGLTGNFAQLSTSEPSAFERRYQQPTTPKRDGNGYV